MDEETMEILGTDDEHIEIVENIPESFPRTETQDLELEHIYKTQQVADRLNVQRQTIINYARVFEEILDIVKTPNGDRFYSEKCISQLAFIFHDKEVSGRSSTQELAYLKTTAGEKNMEVATTGAEGLAKLFEEMQSTLLSSIEDSQRRTMDEMMRRFEEKTQLLEDSQSTAKVYEEKLEQQAKTYMDALAKRESEIDSLKEETQRLREELEEQKKPFWKRRK